MASAWTPYPYLCEREGTINENLPRPRVLKEMRRLLDQDYEARMFLAEANQWPRRTYCRISVTRTNAI